RHQFDTHQSERRVAAFLHIAAEVFDQLFASLSGIDSPAVQRDWPIEAMTTTEHRTSFQEMRGEFPHRPIVVGFGVGVRWIRNGSSFRGFSGVVIRLPVA